MAQREGQGACGRSANRLTADGRSAASTTLSLREIPELIVAQPGRRGVGWRPANRCLLPSPEGTQSNDSHSRALRPAAGSENTPSAESVNTGKASYHRCHGWLWLAGSGGLEG